MYEHKLSAVVVEDEKLLATNIAKTIERLNPHFRVVKTISNGADALTYIRAQPPQVVFTDIRMPILDGLALLEQLRMEHSYIKTVILSGYDDFTYAQRAIRCGAYGYLLKPIASQELATLLQRLEAEITASQPDWQMQKEEFSFTPEEMVAQVKEYISQNYQRPIDFNAISEHFGFSSAYLSKIFTRQEGVPPSQFMRSYRIGVAKQLLSDPCLPVAAVANMVGYTDPFHFSKSFKKETGSSPAAYRQGCRTP